jgi:hypothetical protein
MRRGLARDDMGDPGIGMMEVAFIPGFSDYISLSGAISAGRECHRVKGGEK